MTRIVLLGPPGVGKGTQAAVLARELRVPAVSTGDMFRHHIATSTALGVELQAIVSSGGLVPDSTTTAIVAERLSQDDARDGFILDGYPRTGGQVDDLDDLLAASGLELSRVFLLHAAEDVLASRLAKRGGEQHRADDDSDVVRARFRTYAETITPVVDRYEQRLILSRVDADSTPDAISEHLCEVARTGLSGGLLA